MWRSCSSAGWLAALVVVAASSTGVLGAQASQRYTLQGSDVAVWNLAGTVMVEAGTGGDVDVEVTRRGPDASKLTVATGRIRGRESLRVKFPARTVIFAQEDRSSGRRWLGSTRTTLSVSDDGTFGGESGDGGWRNDGDRVEIRSSGTGLEASADLRVRVPKGVRLELHLAAGEATVTNVEGDISVDVHAADVTTRGTRGHLSLDTGSGEVKVSDATGELTVDSGSGGVTIDGVRGDVLSLDTGSGSMQGANIEVKELRVDTGSGRVSLRRVSCPDIELDTGSGGVELALVADVERLVIDTGSGGVTVEVPESLGARVSAETGSGDVDFDFPVQVTRRGRDVFEGTLGDGKGRITVETGSGSVRFRRR